MNALAKLTSSEFLVKFKEFIIANNITVSQLIGDLEESLCNELIYVFGEFEVDVERDLYEDDRQNERIILSFKKYNVYIMFEGQYNSWDGINYKIEPYLVKPVKKIIITYEMV